MVTTISGARVRTTHVSGMSTDIGIELGTLFDIARGRELGVDAAPYQSKLRLHAQTVLSFLAGGVIGVMVYQAIGGRLLFATASVLLTMSAGVSERRAGATSLRRQRIPAWISLQALMSHLQRSKWGDSLASDLARKNL